MSVQCSHKVGLGSRIYLRKRNTHSNVETPQLVDLVEHGLIPKTALIVLHHLHLSLPLLRGQIEIDILEGTHGFFGLGFFLVLLLLHVGWLTNLEKLEFDYCRFKSG